MAGSEHLVKDAKGYVDKAHKGVKAISDAAAAAKKLQDTGATMSELEEAMAALTWVSKVTKGLQVVSIGLSVLQAFLPKVPSTEDLILAGVKRIEQDLENLKTEMETLFEENERLADIRAIEMGLHQNFGDIRDAQYHMKQLAVHKEDLKALADGPSAERAKLENEIKTHTDHLSSPDTAKEMSNALGNIHDAVTGVDLDTPLLDLTLSVSSANIRVMGALTAKLIKYAETASIILSTNYALGPNGEGVDLEQVPGLVDDEYNISARLVEISDLCGKANRACTHLKTWDEYIPAYYNDARNSAVFGVTPSDLDGTAERIVDGLSAQWPALNFTAIVYRGQLGPDDRAWHMWTGYHGVLSKTRDGDADEDETANVLLYWAPRYHSGITVPIPTKDISRRDVRVSVSGMFETTVKQRVESPFTLLSDLINLTFLTRIVPWRGYKGFHLSIVLRAWALFGGIPKENVLEASKTLFADAKHIPGMAHGSTGLGFAIYSVANMKAKDEKVAQLIAVSSQNHVEMYRPLHLLDDPGVKSHVAGTKYERFDDHTHEPTYYGLFSVLVRPDHKISEKEKEEAKEIWNTISHALDTSEVKSALEKAAEAAGKGIKTPPTGPF